MKNKHLHFVLIVVLINLLIQDNCYNQTVLAPDYQKVYKITKLNSNIEISETFASVELEYEIQNLADDSLSLSVTFLQPTTIEENKPIKECFLIKLICGIINFKFCEKYENEQEPIEEHIIGFEKGETKTSSFVFKIPIGSDRINSIYVDPSIFIFKSLYLESIDSIEHNIIFPSNFKKVLKSNIDFTDFKTDNLRTIASTNQYSGRIIPISIKWTDLDIDLDIDKEVIHVEQNKYDIKIKVKNNNSEPAKSIVLQDILQFEHFIPITPKHEFAFETSEGGDPHYVWNKKIDLIQPKSTNTFIYTVEIKNPIKEIPLTTALSESKIVSISTKPKLTVPVQVQPHIPRSASFILPTGWDFDFVSDDHHINVFRTFIESQSFNTSNSVLSWDCLVSYYDKNKDDDYRWSIQNTIIQKNDAFVYSGISGWRNDNGGNDSRAGSYSSEDLKGFENATVLLYGWAFDYSEDDHHIKKIKVDIKDINYNSDAGRITWNTDVTYRDKNADDDYRWKYGYLVFAFNNGAIQYYSKSGNDDGHNAYVSESYTNSILQGYQNACVIPLGWSLNFKNSDHHINEIGYHIRNVDYNTSSGQVDWQTHFNYSDKNFDDDYSWYHKVAIMVFNEGDAREYNVGPYRDNGGDDNMSFNKDLDDLFVPITWDNEIMDGSETGIDCGGNSPITCMDCINSSVNIGNADDAYVYSLSSGAVFSTAQWALYEYAQDQGQSVDTYYTGIDHADRLVEAIAWFVDQHMDYIKDGGDWKGKQTALRIINESSSRCSGEFCGDCEDHSILRAALLRSLGFDWKCIFSADHHNSFDQGQWDECSHDKKEDDGGHTYNIVYYKGKYRILDYGPMIIRNYSSCQSMHVTDNIWNDHYNEHWDKKRRRPINGKLLMNFPGDNTCPCAAWNWRNYYKDICH